MLGFAHQLKEMLPIPQHDSTFLSEVSAVLRESRGTNDNAPAARLVSREHPVHLAHRLYTDGAGMVLALNIKRDLTPDVDRALRCQVNPTISSLWCRLYFPTATL